MPALSDARVKNLRVRLDALVAQTDRAARLAVDPVGFVHRYDTAADQEVAGVVASVLAYGRVAAFRPVVDAVLSVADQHGGPHAFVVGCVESPEWTAPLAPLVYRWMRGPDLQLLCRTLGRVVRSGPLDDVFVPSSADGSGLSSGIAALRQSALAEASVTEWSALSRGFRYMLPHPSGGSACKRWCMFLRWMVRTPGPGAAGIDLGLWKRDPRSLTVPLDTHVSRIARLVGLTDRKDGSWRTAREVTAGLARIHPGDPLRADFALAHLGISGRCKARYEPSVCSTCALRTACREVPRQSPSTG